jgi:MFS transporter, ACS family, glucarate transporter
MTAPAERPTHVRYGVVGFAVALAIISYFDRVTLSNTNDVIRAELHITKQQMGWVFGAFATAYALFEIPSGYFGDKIGPRRVLMRVVIWWSIFTALMGAAFNFYSLFFTQLFFGAGEAGAFPNITKSFTAWLPRVERVRAQGVIWLAARWGGAFTPLIVYQLLRFLKWREVFVVFACLGVLWAVFFFRWYRDRPADNPHLNQAERDLLSHNQGIGVAHGPVPWKLFMTSPDVIMLCVQYFFMSFSWYFYITWLPTFVNELKLSPAVATSVKILPLFLGGLGALFSGFIAAPLARSLGSVKKARRLLSSSSFACAGICLIVSTLIREPWLKMVAIGFASFCNDVVLPPAWGACMDVGGKFSGTLSGAMNMTGNLGGLVFPVTTGFILDHMGNNWNLVFYLCTASYVFASLLWMRLDPVTPIGQPEGAVLH